MLRKLLKHEFRATGRIMLPVIGILLATSVAANLSMRYLLDNDAWFLSMLGILLLTAFGFAIGGVFIVSFILMIQRFYKNLLQDEGYVMLTLPVSIHQHIWSKLIVSSVWFIVTALAVILACCITAFDLTVVKEILRGMGELFQELRALRSRLSAQRGVPPYVIFNDRSLREMCRQRPDSPAALLQVPGVGERKLEQFGEEFLEVIRRHSM